MKMKHILLVFFLVSQAWQPVAVVRKKFSMVKVDKLGNVWCLTPENDLEKYDKNGKLLISQNFNVKGTITQIDVTNPFDIYCFVQEQALVFYLDNMMSLQGETNFKAGGNTQPIAMGRSYDNNIWIFDAIDLQLKKFSRDKELLNQSGNATVFASGNFIPTTIIDNGESVYLNCINKGVYRFDIFANFVHSVSVDSLNTLAYLNNRLVGFRSGKMVTIEENGWMPMSDTLHQNSTDAYIQAERLYILTPDSLILQAQ